MGYTIWQHHLPPGLNCPNPWQRIEPLGLTIHSTGTLALGKASDTDEFNDAYFHGADRQASAHVFADYDSLTELLPWQPGKAVAAWHAGGYSRRFISLEMCEQADSAKHREMYKRAIWFAATVCHQYGWDPMARITATGAYGTRQLYLVHSHHDISLNLGDTDHTDPDAYLARHGQSMDRFRQDVAALLAVLKGADLGMRTFADIQNHWAKGAIEACANTELPDGTYLLNGKDELYFDPDAPMTRAEVAAVLSRVLRLIGK